MISQAHLSPKVPKKANFLTSLQKTRADIELSEKLLALHCDKS